MKFQVFNENYDSACWHGGNLSHVVATKLISTFAPCWIWCQIFFFGKLMKLHENLVEISFIWWSLDGFCFPACWIWCQIQVLIENLCNYMKTWLKWSYLVAIRWVLFFILLNLVSNLVFCWKFMQITWKDGWNMSYLVATRCVFASLHVLN